MTGMAQQRAPDHRTVPALAVRLLGRPSIERPGTEIYRFRSRKSWALLAYLVLSEHPPARSRLASLLFSEADDPMGALRWALAEIRRSLGEHGALDGDPVVLRLPPDAVVDVEVLAHRPWTEAVSLPGIGEDLLDGLTLHGAAAYESWLLSERRRLSAAAEAILHEAALGWMSRGALEAARNCVVRAAGLSPLDENHQALLIRLYRMVDDDEGAVKQHAAFAALLNRELGVAPGAAVQAAMKERTTEPEENADAASIQAIVESGAAAISAGACDSGARTLRVAVGLADRAQHTALRIDSRLALAEALVHSIGGLDEEGLTTLHEVDRIASDHGDRSAVARARAELGYVDFLRGRYDRSRLWLTEALAFGEGDPALKAKATTYLGALESDRGDYPAAIANLREATALSRRIGDVRREAYGLSMLGRISLLRGDLDAAAVDLEASITLAERDHWLWFLPWPQALRGELHLASGEVDAARRALSQAFARACQFGDPCWEGMSARGLALVAETSGDTARAFDLLAEARKRCTRLTDSYVWLEVHILDAQCGLGGRHGHPETAPWVDLMREKASRTGMRELTVRGMVHAAALGEDGAAAAGALLAADIDNPQLRSLVGTFDDVARERAL